MLKIVCYWIYDFGEKPSKFHITKEISDKTGQSISKDLMLQKNGLKEAYKEQGSRAHAQGSRKPEPL